MKSQFNILLAAWCMIFMLSCDDAFLDTYPKHGVGSAQMWTTAEHAEKGVITLYVSIKDNAIFNIPCQDNYTDMAMLLNKGSTFDGNGNYQLSYNTATANSGMFSAKWERLYRGVAKSNDAIAYLPGIDMDEKRRAELLAEAKFCRALFYFELLSFYSGHDARDLGVPVYLERPNYEEAYFPRSKPAVVRRQMIQDLTEAIPDLPFKSTVRGRVNQAAARMLLGKVYLYAGDYDKAANVFSAVIQDNTKEGTYKLHEDYYMLFQLDGSSSNDEFILLCDNIHESGYGTSYNMMMGNRSQGNQTASATIGMPVFIDSYQLKTGAPFDWSAWGVDLSLTGTALRDNQNAFWNDRAKVNAMFAARDPRLDASFIRPWSFFVGFVTGTGDVTYEYCPSTFTGAVTEGMRRMNSDGDDGFMWRKFVATSNQALIRQNSPIDLPIMRYADLLLLFAEARNEASGPVDSVYWAINQVRQRPTVGMSELSGMNQSQMRQAIRDERGWELSAEGHRYADYRRWYKYDPSFDIERMNGPVTGFNRYNVRANRAFTERCWQYAIPQGEIQLNPYLRQNPGWEY